MAAAAIAMAKGLHENLQKEFSGLAVEALSTPLLFCFHVPSITRDKSNFPQESFIYVGRSWFKDLHDFVTQQMGSGEEQIVKRLKLKDEKQQQRLDALFVHWKAIENEVTFGLIEKGGDAYVLGMPGEGKSYGIAVLAGLLHVQATFATIYLAAKCFLLNPFDVLHRALVLALGTNPDAVAMLQCLTKLEDLVEWVSNRNQMLVLVDDFNAVDDDRKRGGVGSQVDRDRARTILNRFSLRHVVVFCSSFSSKIRLPLTRDPHPPYLLILGGFSEPEFEAFVLAQEASLKDGKALHIDDKDLFKTGKNPQLLRQLIQGQLEPELLLLQEDLEVFLDALPHYEMMKFMWQLAGNGPLTRLPQAMDSRCLYPKDGALVALSDYLLSSAMSRCVQLFHAASVEKQEEVIGYFVAAIRNDSTRIGWNAEEATLLVLSSTLVEVSLSDDQKVQWRFKADKVERFPQGIETVAWDESGAAVFHLPMRFNCKAVDCVMEGKVDGKQVFAGIQISASKDPQASHPGAISHFVKTLTQTCKTAAVLVFVWIGYFPCSFVEEVTVDGHKIIEVTMSFRDVHSLLRGVNEVLEEVRAGELESNVRVQCRVTKPGKEQCKLTVATDGDGGGLCHVHCREKERKVVELDAIKRQLENGQSTIAKNDKKARKKVIEEELQYLK